MAALPLYNDDNQKGQHKGGWRIGQCNLQLLMQTERCWHHAAGDVFLEKLWRDTAMQIGWGMCQAEHLQDSATLTASLILGHC